MRSSPALLAALLPVAAVAQTAPPPSAVSAAATASTTATPPPLMQLALPPALQPIVLRTPTPAETRANDIWAFRAAMNVAALQCQFSPFLATVRNYNQILQHHGTELGGAMRTMTAHFRRVEGPKVAQTRFDQYTTRTYNGFSTLQAQFTFCEAAGYAGREALMVRKGQLGDVAGRMLPLLRTSLIPTVTGESLRTFQPAWEIVAMIPDPCIDARGRRIRQC